jgi:hypothetical protein
VKEYERKWAVIGGVLLMQVLLRINLDPEMPIWEFLLTCFFGSCALLCVWQPWKE